MSDYAGKKHVLGSFNMNNSEIFRLSLGDIFSGTLDTYMKNMNPCFRIYKKTGEREKKYSEGFSNGLRLLKYLKCRADVNFKVDFRAKNVISTVAIKLEERKI